MSITQIRSRSELFFVHTNIKILVKIITAMLFPAITIFILDLN